MRHDAQFLRVDDGARRASDVHVSHVECAADREVGVRARVGAVVVDNSKPRELAVDMVSCALDLRATSVWVGWENECGWMSAREAKLSGAHQHPAAHVTYIDIARALGSDGEVLTLNNGAII